MAARRPVHPNSARSAEECRAGEDAPQVSYATGCRRMTLDQVELKVDVSKLIQGAKLTDRELQVLQQRFGLCGETMTLDEIGEELQVSKELIRQIEIDPQNAGCGVALATISPPGSGHTASPTPQRDPCNGVRLRPRFRHLATATCSASFVSNFSHGGGAIQRTLVSLLRKDAATVDG